MSFDLRTDTLEREVECVSIPLEQGNVFRRLPPNKRFPVPCVSIPLEQGNVFRPKQLSYKQKAICLNPFGTGQCLSTIRANRNVAGICGLNPFGTGQCLST